MNSVVIHLEQKEFRPLEEVSGRVSWDHELPVERLEVVLFWFTEGRGDQDVGVVSSEDFAVGSSSGEIEFSLRLPEGPYSVSGRLVSILWAVEALGHPRDLMARQEILVSPTRREIVITSPESPPV